MPYNETEGCALADEFNAILQARRDADNQISVTAIAHACMVLLTTYLGPLPPEGREEIVGILMVKLINLVDPTIIEDIDDDRLRPTQH